MLLDGSIASYTNPGQLGRGKLAATGSAQGLVLTPLSLQEASDVAEGFLGKQLNSVSRDINHPFFSIPQY